MIIEETALAGAYRMKPKLHPDERGYFYECFNQRRFFDATGIKFEPVQFNCSKSSKGVLRGLHFQRKPNAQSKLVGVVQGEIQDVIVDLRKGSPTFEEFHSEIISEDDKKQLYVPKGFAHGFLVLSEKADVFYAIDNCYSSDDEGGVLYNDPYFKINWELPDEEIILSKKDSEYKKFESKGIHIL